MSATPSMKPQILPIFPTPVMHAPRALPLAACDAIVQRIRGEQRAQNAKSDRLSHTTPVNAESDPLFAETARTLSPLIIEFGAHLFGERLTWSIKEIWVNVLETGGAQALHNHANSFISGVVYLTESHAKSGTVFHKALGGSDFSFVNQNARSRMGPFNASRWQIPPVAPGDMVLFPSYMLHEVPRNEGAERITMAFNALPDRLDSWGYAVQFN